MNKVLIGAWPLFFGLALIMVGNGLQGTLLGVRANIEGFSTATTGLVMSLYYFGFLAGSIAAPKLVRNVGHIRVFAALASLASTTVLLHAIFPSAILWGLVRIVTGFGFAGLYIVIESWLNGMADNRNRGQVLGLYILITYGCMAIGQFLLSVADPSGPALFILTSVLVSCALVPISLSKREAPVLPSSEHVSLKKIYSISPLGVIGAFMSGISGGTVFAIGAVFAIQSGMTTLQVSSFMASIILGGMCFQYPVGWISDRIDRRLIIITCAALASLVAFLCTFFTVGWGLYSMVFIFWGLGVPIYALSIAYTNDYIEHDQILAASSSLILLNGAGACIGPLAVTIIMSIFGPISFFPALSAIFATTCVFAIYRSTVRETVPLEEQGSFVGAPARGAYFVAQYAEEEATEEFTEDEQKPKIED
jgi:MFS family permease